MRPPIPNRTAGGQAGKGRGNAPCPGAQSTGCEGPGTPPPSLLVALGQPLAPLRGQLLARGAHQHRLPVGVLSASQRGWLLLGRQGQVARGARRSSARAAGLREPELPEHGRKDAVLPGRRDASTGGGGDACREEGTPAPGESRAGGERGMLAGREGCLRGRWDTRGLRAGLGTAEPPGDGGDGGAPWLGPRLLPALSDSAPA